MYTELTKRIVSKITEPLLGRILSLIPIFSPLSLGAIEKAFHLENLPQEVAMIYLNSRYPLPNEDMYTSYKEGNWIFYINNSKGYFFDPIPGSAFLDPVASFGTATVYLGALPLHSHADWLASHHVTDVISLVEDHEYNIPLWIGDVVQKADWENKGMTFYHFPSPDFHPLSEKTLKQSAELLQKIILEGKSVYVHCKAGRGRSSTVVAAVLAKMTRKPVEEIISILKQARPQVTLDDEIRKELIRLYAASS